MEKRVLIAVILSFVVLYGYQAMFPPPKPADIKPLAGSQTTTPSTTTIAPESPAQTTPPLTPESSTPAAAALVADRAERDIAVESEAVSAVFSTRGAVLKSWRLKKYPDSSGKPLELIPHTVPTGTPRPFTLSVADASVTATLTKAPGNGAAIGGLKVTTESGWFAARPSGTEDVYKIYAESFRGPEHLAEVQQAARDLVGEVLSGASG